MHVTLESTAGVSTSFCLARIGVTPPVGRTTGCRFATCAAVLMALLLVPRSALSASKPCATSLGKCPLRGCAKAGSPNALSNSIKRTGNLGGEAIRLTFKDFSRLQERVEQRFGGDYATLTKPDRLRLRNLTTVGENSVGEGDYVEVVGYIAVQPATSKPHANKSGESVNCRLKGTVHNDFHISITPQPGSEYGGIVVEMIPQDRVDTWTEGRLRRVQVAEHPVRVRGQLLFDNHHKVNDDPKHLQGGQPKRFSLWEIHPVVEFAVCDKANCTEAQWTELEKWEG